jgi:hypothetical protein
MLKRLYSPFRVRSAASFEARQLLQGGAKHVFKSLRPRDAESRSKSPRVFPGEFSTRNSRERSARVETAAEAPKEAVNIAAAIDEENRHVFGSWPLWFLKGMHHLQRRSTLLRRFHSIRPCPAVCMLPVSMKAAQKAPSSALDTSFLPIII